MTVSPELIEKIRALYRLSRDPANEHEAALAASKVRELLEKHNLGFSDISEDQQQSAEHAVKYSTRIEPFHHPLARACCALFDVEYFEDVIDRLFGARLRAIVFCGFPANAETATLTFHYFCGSVQSLLRGQKGIKAASRQRLYRQGAATRICVEARELKQQAVERSEQTAALVHIGNAVAKRHLKNKGTKTRTLKGIRPGATFMQGFYDAAQVNLRGAGRLLE